MDAAVLLILTFISLICWLVVIADGAAPLIYRALGIVFGLPVLVWYGFHVMGATKSPVWNGDIGGGPVAVIALALGMIAFMSRERSGREAPGTTA